MQQAHIHLWLAAASLHEAGRDSFSRSELLAEVDRLFHDRRPGVTAYMDSHANASSKKAIPTVYNYLIRVDRGRFRLGRTTDPVHPSRAGVRMWPDQADVDHAFWSLWRKWSRWQALELAGDEVAAAVAVPVTEEEDEVESDVHYRLSTYREAMLEHLLIGELMRQLWPTPLEVCKPQVDAAGYDLILQCRGVLRHVQLKTSFEGAATREVPISVELGRRQGGCVIWTRFDPRSLAPIEFWWFGGGPGAPLPALSEYRVANYTRANSQGVKAERSSHRMVPRSGFSRVESVEELLTRLFGVVHEARGDGEREQ